MKTYVVALEHWASVDVKDDFKMLDHAALSWSSDPIHYRYRQSTLMEFIDPMLDRRHPSNADRMYSVLLLLKSCIEIFSLVADKSISDHVIDNISCLSNLLSYAC